jgi:hypothetical protein
LNNLSFKEQASAQKKIRHLIRILQLSQIGERECP